MFKKSTKTFRRSITFCFCCNVNSFAVYCISQCRSKFCLLKDISSGKGNASSGSLVKDLVLPHDLHHFFSCVHPAAVGSIRHFPGDPGKAVLRFRVGTPFALQGAAFEEYCSPNTRPVVDAEFLYIQDKPFSFHSSFLSSVQYYVL